VTDAADGFELGLDVGEAGLDLAAVGFELGFAGAAGADAAAELRHGATPTGEARELVFELGELDLELAFAGFGVAGEDVQDELGAVDDVAGEARLDVAELRGGEVVVEEDQRGVGAGDDGDDLVELALADEAGWIGLLAALDERRGDGRASGTGEFLELGAGGGEVDGWGFVVCGVFAGNDGGCGAREMRGGGELLALAELAGELDDDEDGELLLGLRGAELAGEEGFVLRAAGFDQAARSGFGAAATGFWFRGELFGGLVAGQWLLNPAAVFGRSFDDKCLGFCMDPLPPMSITKFFKIKNLDTNGLSVWMGVGFTTF